MSGYPGLLVPVGHEQPLPRRIRAVLGGVPLVDTVRARYVWEHSRYPWYHLPLADVADGVLVDEGGPGERVAGRPARRHGLRAGGERRPGAALVFPEQDAVRFDWDAVDAWFEEDEQVFVHPRDPYTRVDALRSGRRVRIELEGTVLAESPAPVIVFETGLPPRYYLGRTEIDSAVLVPSGTVTACPYKGRTSGYWSARVAGRVHPDLAWSYDFPTRELQPVAGLVAFYTERVDVWLDSVAQPRPVTHFVGPDAAEGAGG
ncbi:MAG TPA: DUF427 domain-containing protein [Pseudonocardia sp.]|jgi:uncharacterized protein (DUF427 family)